MRWSQLVVLMALGEGVEPPVRGVVSCRWQEPVGFANFPATGGVEHVNGVGPVSVYAATYRVLKRGDLIRRERLDGTVSSIERGREFWTVATGDGTATHYRAAHMTFPDEQLTHRRPLREWSNDDFTRPATPIEPVVYLGRKGWQVDVSPPRGKQHPMRWIVDDETGLLLSAVSAGGGSVWWDELEVGADLSPDLFEWSGPTRPPGNHQRPPPG